MSLSKKWVLIWLSLFSFCVSAKSKKTHYSFGASYKHLYSKNLDGLSDIESLNKDAQSNIITANLYIKSKVKNIRVKSKTQVLVETLHSDIYQGEDVVNSDSLNLDNRNRTISQSLSASYKFNKKLYLSTELDYEKKQGYFVVTKLQILPDGSISKDIEYNILNAKAEKIGATLSSRYKFSRKLKLYGVYRFNEYYHTDQYTFAGDQGTNDRRINSAGVLAKYSVSKRFKLSSDVQATHTLYKNRLTTLENGGFNRNGIVDRAAYFDTRLGFGIRYIFASLDLDQNQRRDEAGGGDGHNSLGAKLSLDYNLGRMILSGGYNRTVKTYTTQTATEGSDNRKDQGYEVSLKVGYKISNNFKAISSLVRSRVESNNVFGQNNGQTIGLEIDGTF